MQPVDATDFFHLSRLLIRKKQSKSNVRAASGSPMPLTSRQPRKGLFWKHRGAHFRSRHSLNSKRVCFGGWEGSALNIGQRQESAEFLPSTVLICTLAMHDINMLMSCHHQMVGRWTIEHNFNSLSPNLQISSNKLPALRRDEVLSFPSCGLIGAIGSLE